MPRRIDLHTHSTASDGTTAPSALMSEARAAGLDVVALTDHDTTGGWDEAAASMPTGLSLVRGAEISCRSGPISLHLLAYLFDRHEPRFAAARAELRTSRRTRAEQMVGLLTADGHPVSWAQVQDLAGGTVGRPHIAHALIDSGLVSSIEEAFTPAWIGTRGRYWVDKLELDVLAAVALVAGAGGVSVFAHPAAVKRGRTVGDDVVAAMAAAGLAGLEVDHADHDGPARSHLRGLAAELGLVTTGSSDFHGTRKSVRLGDSLTDEGAYEALVAAATGLPVLAA